MDWLKRWFGEGKIRIEMVTVDGRKAVGTVPYIGDISTLDPAEFKRDVINQAWVNKGERVKDVTILGWY
jgi:hypothetical protein